MKNLLVKLHNAGFKFLSSGSAKNSYGIIVREFLPIFDGFEGSIFINHYGKLQRIYSTTPLFDSIKFEKDDIRYRSFKRITPKILTEKEMKIERTLFPVLKKAKVKSIILVPLSQGKKPIGLLVIWSKKEKPNIKNNPEQTKLLGMIVSLFVRGSNLFEQEREDPEKLLSDIYDSTLKFLSPLDATKTYETIAQEAVKLVNGEYSSIILEENGELKRVYATSPVAFKTKNRKKSNTYKAFTQKKAIIVTISETGRAHPELKKIGIQSTIFIPLSSQGETIGVLTVNSKENKKFSRRELGILKLFGSLASLSIRKAQLFDDLKNALQTRDLFISMAAHELRTPLTSVIGYFQLLRGRIEGKKTVPSKWIEDMDIEIERLKQIAEEFLEINRIRTGKLQYDFKEVGLKKLINRSIAAFKFSHPERKIVFANSFPQNDKVVGDRDRLIQVITNILENAVKYSSAETQVNVSLKSDEDNFLIEIKDRGQGILKKEIPQLFKGFYKGKNSQHEGMGLGLYLAKNIIDQHHGNIKIDSEIDKGTNVAIELPKAEI